MALAPDKAPTLADLVALGALHIDVRGTDFDPRPDARGIDRKAKVLKWQVSIVHKDMARPMIRAVRDDVGEAFKDAASRFVLMTDKAPGKFTDTVSTPADWKATALAAAKAKQKSKPKPVVEPDHDDADDMI